MNPTDFQYLFQELVNEREVESHSFGMDIKAANATISVLTPDGFTAHYGGRAERDERGILGQAILFAVKDVPAFKQLMSSRNIGYSDRLGRVIIERAVGQGAIFAFEAE